MKRCVRYSLIVVSVLIISLLALAGAAHLSLTTERGRTWALATFNDLIPGDIAAQKISLSLFGQRVVLDGAVLTDPYENEVIRSDHVTLRLDLPALLKEEVILKRIDLVRPLCTIAYDRTLTLTIVSAFTDDTSGEEPQEEPLVGPFAVKIESLLVQDGRVLSTIGPKDLKVVLEHLDLDGGADFSQARLWWDARAQSAQITTGDLDIDLGGTTVQGNLVQGSITDLVLTTARGQSMARVSGGIKDLDQDPFMDLSADLAVSGTDIENIPGIPLRLTGILNAHLTLQGTLETPGITCTASYGGRSVAGRLIGKTDLSCTLKDSRLVVQNLSMDIASGTVSVQGEADLRQVFPKGLFSGEANLDRVSYDGTIRLDELHMDEIPVPEPSISGIASGEIELSGTGVSPGTLGAASRIQLSARKFSVGDAMKPLDVDLKAEGTIDGPLLSIKKGIATSGDIELSVQGTTNLSNKSMDAALQLAVGDISTLLSPYGITGSGEWKADAEVSGSWDQPLVSLTLDAEKVMLEEVFLGQVNCMANLERNGTVRVKDLSVQNSGSRISGSGFIRIYERFPEIDPGLPLTLDLALKAVRLSDFIHTAPVSGSIDGSIAVTGTLSSPDARLGLTGSDLAAGDIRLGSADLEGRFSRGVLTLGELTITNRNSVLDAHGTIRILEPDTLRPLADPIISLAVDADTLRLEDFTSLAQGSCMLHSLLQGSLLHPAGRMDLTGKDLALFDQKISQVTVRASSDGEIIEFSPVSLSLGENERITGTGWLSFDTTFEFRMNSTGISLNSLQPLRDADLLQGLLLIDASGSGSIDRPEISARLDITNVRLKGEALPDWHIDARLEEHTIQATGRLNFDIDASYDLKQDLFSAAARFDQTDLSPYFTLMGRKNLTGTISGSVDAHGNVRNLMDSRVQMNVSSIQVFYTGTEIIRSRDVHASFQDGILVLPSSRIILGSEGWMDIRGEGRTDATLRITTEGRIPLEVLGSFQEDPSEAEGSLRFSAQITGTLSKPEFIAVLGLQDIGYRIPPTGQKIHDLNGIIRITESEVAFENIEGMLETGVMTAGGTIMLSELNPSGFDLTLRAVNLPVAVPDTMDMTIDGNLSLTGPVDSSLLSGEFLILEGTYYRDVKLNLLTGVSRLLSPERRTSVQAPVQVPEYVENIELQIVVKRRGTVAVDNNIAYLEINPDLLIRGTMTQPVITGRMSVLEGTITYQKKDFVITKGVIDFVNPYTTEASIDITGEVPVRRWTIFLGITGSFEEMVFSLRSDPPEEDADILSLLAFGKTTGEFITGAGGTLTTTSGMIAELVASTFSEDIKEVTTLDIFELESVRDASTDDADAMRLLLGKELSRRMTIKYEMETRNSEMTQRAIAEYKLLENLLLNGFQDNKGIFGADVQFRLEFR